jgi:hypothetical protein
MPGIVVVEAVRASRSRAFADPPADWGGYMQIDDGFQARFVLHCHRPHLACTFAQTPEVLYQNL